MDMDEEDDLPVNPDPSVPDQDELADKGPSDDEDQPLPVEQADGDENLLADVDAIGADLEAAGADDAPAAATDIAPPPVKVPDIAEPPAPFGDDLGRVDLTAEAPPPDMAEVDATTRELEAMGRDIEAFHAGNIPPAIDPQQWGGDDGGNNNQDDISGAFDADFQNRDTMTGFIAQHERRIQELTRRLESERL